MIDLERQGDVFVLRMRAGENRFNPDFLKEFNGALDEVEGAGVPSALVTTGEGKFYSNGLDLEWMGGPGAAEAGTLLADVLRAFARVLTFPAYTVAALNGHAFAGGGMLALAHDARVMRADRGYFCLPEVDLGLPLHPGMTALIQARLAGPVAHEAIVSGARYGGEAAREAGIVDVIAPEAQVLAHAIERAQARAAKASPVMAQLKRGLYPRALEALGEKPAE